MKEMILKLIKPLISLAKDIGRNRLLNKQTTKGVLLLCGGAYALGYIDEKTLNALITLLSGTNLGYADVWLFIINAVGAFGVITGCYYIWKKVHGKPKRNKKVQK